MSISNKSECVSNFNIIQLQERNLFLFFANILFTGVRVEFLAPQELERSWSDRWNIFLK